MSSSGSGSDNDLGNDKRPSKVFSASKYKDIEAQDDESLDSSEDDEEDIEDGEADVGNDFIVEDDDIEQASINEIHPFQFFGHDLDTDSREPRAHNSSRRKEKEEIEKIASKYKNYKYYESDRFEISETDSANTPIAQWRISLIPTAGAKKLYLVHVKPSKELYVVYFFMKKYFKNRDQTQFPTVYSAFFTNKGSGIVFVEAITPREVQLIKYSVPNAMSQPIKVVPTAQMPGCLATPARREHIVPGQFVRIKRDNKNESYQNDLAQVVSIDANSNRVLVKLIPRIDYSGLESLKNEKHNDMDDDDLELKQTELTREKVKTSRSYRPPQDDFNYERLRHISVVEKEKPKVLRGIPKEAREEIPKVIYYWDDTYLFHTFAYKYYLIDRIITNNISVGPDEPNKFISGLQFEKKIPNFENNMYSSLGMTSHSTFSVDDIAIVREGEYQNLIVRIVTIDDQQVTVRPVEGETIDFQIERENLEKYFNAGDHVKVTNGQYINQTGEVQSIDKRIATVLLDTQYQTIDVPIGYLAITHEINQGQKSIGNYQLFDYILLTDQETRGVIWRIENKTIYILQTTGQSKTTTLDGILSKQRDRSARDSNSRPIIVGQTVVVDTPEYKQIRAQVKHISHEAVFLHNDSITKYNGLFVVEPNDCQASTSPPDSNYLQPQRFVSGRSPQLREYIGKTIMITSGPYKNQLATIKEADQASIRVLMHKDSRPMSFNTKDGEDGKSNDQRRQIVWKIIDSRGTSGGGSDPFSKVFGPKRVNSKPAEMRQMNQPAPSYGYQNAYQDYSPYQGGQSPYSNSPYTPDAYPATPYQQSPQPYPGQSPYNTPYSPNYSPNTPQYDRNNY